MKQTFTAEFEVCYEVWERESSWDEERIGKFDTLQEAITAWRERVQEDSDEILVTNEEVRRHIGYVNENTEGWDVTIREVISRRGAPDTRYYRELAY